MSGNRGNITSSSDMGCYINSSQLVNSFSGGSNSSTNDQQQQQQRDDESISTECTKSQNSDTVEVDDEFEFTPTQEINYDEELYNPTNLQDCDNTTMAMTPDEVKMMADTQVKTSGENKNNFKHLVKLKSTLKNYEIPYQELVLDKELGKGFFGKVYKAYWRGKSVAIKKITINRFRDRSEADIFQKELDIISKLCHPTCVMFIGAVSDEQNRCIVMEYMAGGSLRKLLDEKTQFVMSSPHTQFTIARDIALGMEYLHTNFHDPIIHRDLTSSNILLDGNYTVAKINDFGLSKEMKPGPNEMTAAMGSLAWMAPESFKGEKYTEKVDIYSYSIILWELLTCRDPYCGMEPLKMAFVAAMEDYRPPLQGIPDYWQSLIIKCWNPIPTQRPTFTEILQLLDSIEQNLNVFNSNTNNNCSNNNNNNSNLATPTNSISSSSSSMSYSKPGYYASDDQGAIKISYDTENFMSIEKESPGKKSGSSYTPVNQSDVVVQDFNQDLADKIKYVTERSGFLISFKNPLVVGGGFISYYNLQTFKLIKRLQIPSPVVVMNYQIIEDKLFLAVASVDFQVSIYNIDNASPMSVQSANMSLETPLRSFSCGCRINDISWNGVHLITALSDSTLKIWDIENGSYISSMEGHIGEVLSVDSHPTQPLVVSGGMDHKIKLWDSRNGHCFRFFQCQSSVVSVRLRSTMRDPVLISGSTQGYFKVWNMYTSTCLSTYQPHFTDLLGIHSNPIEKQILTYSSDGSMCIFNSEPPLQQNQQQQQYNINDLTQEPINISKAINVNNIIKNQPIQSAQLISRNRVLFTSSNKLYSILIN
ncbi:WD-40 repeat-containing protein [Tieghemostelium lacteum]|uniref:WD-40 repeat-containing protein n=1 Tax=Tieghemostelium lacteum TaxID=361077 RepID=A0A152A1V6_TIELA|nr:WD-40 repeat-containing protein [Tieghemostelium lacteum]|eukprot:KYR00206.1 WD-40 repeat-containing protein [Tieghemostelium lacteum]